MNAARVVLAATLLLVGLWANLNPEVIDGWVDDGVPAQSDDIQLVGLQAEEQWLVLRVQFPDQPFSQSKADSMLGGDDSAASYVDQMSNSASTLSITESSEVWVSPHPESHWGADSNEERDVGVTALVEQSAAALLSGEDLSKWDFDDDGTVDRLLILHSGGAQESGGGSDAIWSHMSWLDEPLEVGDWQVGHYTVASLDSGIGTVIHEMLHQMGAHDLYDVHSDLPSSSWNGLGDWDIMASGNWNGNGDVPAMPGAATLNLIGAHRSIAVNPSIGGSYEMAPISDGGSSLSIPIAPSETIWVTFRGDSGFDSALPGHGIIVEHSDDNNGNAPDNLVNTDPDNAWVKIVEADGDDGLQRGRDTGKAGDAFSTGDEFGNEGMMIRDNRGRLVGWIASVTSMTPSSATLVIEPGEASSVDILTPRSPIQFISGESVYATVTASQPCNLELSLSSSHSGDQVVSENIEISIGTHEVEILSSAAVSSDSGRLLGVVGCEGEAKTDIELDWLMVGHRLSVKELYAVVSWDSSSTVYIRPLYEGGGERTYSIAVEGAASRIATASTPVTLSPGDPITLDIDPAGLLEPGMIARGNLVLLDIHGEEQRIPLLLEAESPFTGDGLFAWLAEPSNGMFVVCLLLAVSVLTGGRGRAQAPSE
ncbi:MAG: M6 family metalloprotease domain-containing protein [Candidatus Thalassarchaeum sp.]|nr:M6 family metalloprotease domain-containing protein [Candidatus Thalassarchaeum sp.]